jgi:monofunctional biosynthetic peptidoglycan transglycosylase
MRRLLVILLQAGLALLATSAAVVGILGFLPPPTTAFMVEARLARDGRPVAYAWRSASHISPELRLAVLAAEDQRFGQHAGFDFDAIQKAARHNSRGGSVRGASTISQQVAKNLFLWPGRSYVRKGIEAAFTVLIEAFWTKRRILEVYVNIAEMGDGVFGAEAASRRFFGKSAAALTREEAALLAAVLPNPREMNVARPSSSVRRRQQWILKQMQALGGTRFLDRL